MFSKSVSSVSAFASKKFKVPPSVTSKLTQPLLSHADIKDAEKANAASLEKINENLGSSWTLDFDYSSLAKILKDEYPKSNVKAGVLSTNILNGLSTEIARLVRKDEKYKYKLAEEVSTIKGPKFVSKSELQNGLHKTTITDGSLVIYIADTALTSELENVGYDLESSL
ncbi:uncharacterized protein RJT20DRAFT_60838 [Scheffersomyces xylosifermentans]|uniref:uncharacterized protein n=1 Tax=Scheffersomyces xylosifermentans TaxID=1304137 RepID=UPI00315D78F3